MQTELSQMHRLETARRVETAMAIKAATRFGVFAWTELNRYPVANAVGGKLYVSQKVAQKAADKLGCVVRTVVL